jgi:cation transport regulator ChaC
MAQQPGLSRRSAMSLFGAVGASAIAGPVATRPHDVRRADAFRITEAEATDVAVTHGSEPATKLQYIFGYGSLVQRESRMATWASAEFAFPVVVEGISRGWFDQFGAKDSPSASPTYLGAVLESGARCNGVIFEVTPSELVSYNAREIGYTPGKINPSMITMLDGSASAPDADIWFYGTAEKQTPTERHPIVQSYVDVCLDGCLEIEAAYPLAKRAEYAKEFIKTTSNWQPPWVNDRIYPWRPTVYVPRATEIDALLQDVLGRELLNQITLR